MKKTGNIRFRHMTLRNCMAKWMQKQVLDLRYRFLVNLFKTVFLQNVFNSKKHVRVEHSVCKTCLFLKSVLMIHLHVQCSRRLLTTANLKTAQWYAIFGHPKRFHLASFLSLCIRLSLQNNYACVLWTWNLSNYDTSTGHWNRNSTICIKLCMHMTTPFFGVCVFHLTSVSFADTALFKRMMHFYALLMHPLAGEFELTHS